MTLWGRIPSHPNDADIIHLLSRTTSGVCLKDFDHAKDIGIENYINEQLQPERMVPSQKLSEKIDEIETSGLSALDMYQRYFQPNMKNITVEEKKALMQSRKKIGQDAMAVKIYRSYYSNAQLAEVMDDFWFNHFNVFWQKGFNPFLIGTYDREAIQPYVLGRFRDMLGAVAKHPAMLIYLDNTTSVKADSPNGKGLNENFAREVMELHTLGVGQYTQKDVTELARILTGWHTRPNKGFFFARMDHDMNEKVFLGTIFPANGGVEEGEKALDMLASSSVTAHHLAYQLCVYFVSDTPSDTLVNNISSVFLSSDGDIRATVSAILHSDDFWAQKNRNNKFKNPYQYVISALRATDIDLNTTTPIINTLNQMGMPIYGRLTPDGYPILSTDWISPSGMQDRINFSVLLGSGHLAACDGLCIPNQQSLIAVISPLDPLLARTIKQNPPNLTIPLILGSKQMMMY